MANILIIEPDPLARQLLEEFVTELGHQVWGPQDVASGPGPDLVLVEPAVPASLAEARSVRERQAHVPIVCVSSEHPTDEVAELETSAFLMKPFRGRLLDWAISEALDSESSLVAA